MPKAAPRPKDPATIFTTHPHPSGMRLGAEGLSHGLKKCPPDTFYLAEGKVGLSSPSSSTKKSGYPYG
ncbi:MAG: hypothetical protein UHU06_04385, partial [Acinetobacter pseudolwoffii]|nr:hypothetical protein [Acinetobacter pseudolwoffii]